MSLGADEFSVRLLMHGSEEGKQACDRLVERLAQFSRGQKGGEYTTRYGGDSVSIEVWRLEPPSLDMLRAAVMPRGVMGSDWSLPAFGEDLCLYRGGELIFGSVAHEHEVFLRLSDDEWRRFEGWSADRGRPGES